MPGLIKFILSFLIFYYAFKFLSRIFAPIIIKGLAKKMTDRFQNYHNQQYEQQDSSKEGEVTIDARDNNRPRKKDDMGDYVDFEEIEDKKEE